MMRSIGIARTPVFRAAAPRSFRSLAARAMRDISPREAQSAVQDNGATYLDVRTAEEFGSRRVAGAINVPFLVAGPGGMTPNPAFVEEVESKIPDKTTKLVVACQLGGRSAKAANQLAELGYTDVSNMQGGLNAWLAQELPVA